ncbi:YfiR family protein [Ancylomarina sp. YFZ004]
MAQVDQDLLRAAYMERITRFVEWPSECLSDENTIITVGVVNNPAFANTIKEIFKSQKIKNRTVKVLSLLEGDDISSCQICFIDKIDSASLKSTIPLANKYGILLFSQNKMCAKAGVHINFFIDKGKLKFEINKSSVDSAGFKISHLLMKSARIL